MKYIESYISELVGLTIEMAPWLILGFLIAGVLHVFFPDGEINRLLGRSNVKSVIKAALLGIPLPLCSCGVIPTGISIYKNGASKGAAVSFLISTPQTGVDSIMVTYSMMGLPFAIVRPIVALLTGVFGGAIANKGTERSKEIVNSGVKGAKTKIKKPFREIFKYAFVDFLADIAKWLVIGLLIAALIAVIVPDDFFASYIKSDFLGMLIILLASIPVYVCATSSVPVAAVLLMKGLSPGAALVFLMAGPATNAATISVVGNAMGRKTLISYLVSIIAGALAFGLVVDYLLPREWFTLGLAQGHLHHEHSLLPNWLELLSGIVMTAAILNIFLKKYYMKWFTKKPKQSEFRPVFNSNEIKVTVKGMNCSHCKANVENNLSKLNGINTINANIETEEVTLIGNNIDLDAVKKTVESIGYKYLGKNL